MGSVERLVAIVHKFAGKRIAVVGDLMLDVYIWGTANRISPEAPVPIVRVTNQSSCLGGAANVMRNIVTLGGDSLAFGITGDDHDGLEIKKMLAGYGINDKSVYTDPARKTTQKQRIIAGTQQLLRIDYENTNAIDESFRQNITQNILSLIEGNFIDGIIFEDYGKGVLNEEMLEAVVAAAQRHRIITALDPKPGHLRPVKGLNVIKPNRSEAFAMAGRFNSEINVPVEHDFELREVAEQLLTEWEPEYLLVSLAAQGMALFRKNETMTIIPTRAREVFDVSGAGDTVISAFTLAMTAGATCVEAAEVANHAGGIVVGKVGTVTVNAAELIDSFSDSR
jgi:rfaE bifunctional protein kinase chain/domain